MMNNKQIAPLKMLPFDQKMLLECVDLFIDTFSQAPYYEVFESTQPVINLFNNYLQNNYFIGYVLTFHEQIIAFSIGVKKPWLKGLEYYIDTLCVNVSYQRQGIGSHFLKMIETELIKQGIDAYMVTTTRGLYAESFYLKHGFKKLDQLVLLAK